MFTPWLRVYFPLTPGKIRSPITHLGFSQLLGATPITMGGLDDDPFERVLCDKPRHVSICSGNSQVSSGFLAAI